MQKRHNIASQRGSLTIETAIVFSTVFFMLIALIYAGLLMYQYAYMQSLASKAAQRGAAIYSESCKDMITGSIYVSDMSERDPYDTLFNSKKDIKDGRVSNFIKSQINTYALLVQGQPRITVESKNYVLFQYIQVTVSSDYRLPAGNLLRAFGLNSTFPLAVSAEAAVNNPAEFLRNTDFITETASGIMSEAGSNNKLSGTDYKTGFSRILGKIISLWKK